MWQMRSEILVRKIFLCFKNKKGGGNKMISSLIGGGTGLSGIAFSNIEIILIFATVIPFFTFVIAVLTSSSQSYYERKPVADGSGWKYVPRHRHLESMLHTLVPTFITAYKMLSVHLATCVIIFGIVFYGLIICGGCWLGIFEWNRQFGLHLVSEENVDTTSTFMYDSTTVGGSNTVIDHADADADMNSDADSEKKSEDDISDSCSECETTTAAAVTAQSHDNPKPSPFVILKSFLIREFEPLAPIASALTSVTEIVANKTSTTQSTTKSNSSSNSNPNPNPNPKKLSSKKKTETTSENSINEALLATLQNIESRISKIEQTTTEKTIINTSTDN
jgi:hypothetical protein